MANGIVAVKLTWEDTSTGALDETGQEIDIWTDSPSFVPNVPINYTEARHPWMRLPPIAAAVEEIIIPLRAPVTFVKFRVRQYNAKGNGSWANPILIPVTQAVGSEVPSAPINLGVVVTGEAPVPPDLPDVDPPDVDPPDTGGGGSSSNYVFASQFSGVQGQNQWSYRDSAGALLVYDPLDSKWNGDEIYLAVWSSGFRHGSTGVSKSAVVRYTVPEAGEATVQGAFLLYSAPGSVTVSIEHNGVAVFGPQNIVDATVYPYDLDLTVAEGDTIDFINARLGGSSYNNNVQLNPIIQLTTDGTTPTNPVVSALNPTTAIIGVNGVGSLTVLLSSAPSVAATIALTSSAPTKVTVPATVTVPAGLISAAVPISGVAVGASIITATYNSSSKTSTITVSAPASAVWTNAPVGGTVLADTNCAVLPGNVPRFWDVFGTTLLDFDQTAPNSPSSCWKARLEALAQHGGNQLEFSTLPTRFREMYVGLYWRTNPQFQGRIATNKLWLLGGYDTMGGFFLFGASKIQNGQAPLLWTLNTGGISNEHLVGTNDPGALFYPNVGNGTVRVGVWYKVEMKIRASTTRTSRDGLLQWWINDVLVGSYPNLNYCGPNGETLDRWLWTQTWDGAFDMGQSNTAAWEHWIDHLYIVGKN